MRPRGRATGAVGRSLGDTRRGEDARRGSSIPRSPVSRKPRGAFCVWASLLMPDAAHRFGVRLRVGLAAAAAPLLRAGPPARLALCVRACLLPHRLPLCAGPARALFSLPPRDSARSHCVSFSFSFSSRGGGVGFGEGLGEGGVLAPCEEGSGGGVRPLCVGAPGPADAAVLPVRFRRPAALLLHCLCLQAIGEFQIHSIVRLPLSS